MIASFYNVFKKQENTKDIPDSVKKVLNSNLPDGYAYRYNEELGHLVVDVVDKNAPQTFTVTFKREDLDEYPEWAKETPEALMEYLYRAQKSIRITDAIIKKDGKQISLSDMVQNPFSDDHLIEKQSIYPSPFPKPMPIQFELADGEIITIKFQRQPCESRELLKFQNIDNNAVIITWELSDPFYGKDEAVSKTKISVTPKKTGTVKEAVSALKLLEGYVNETVKINGEVIGKRLETDSEIDSEQIHSQINFWNNLLKLENLLGVEFIPSADLPDEDERFYGELAIVFIEKKDLIYTEPFKYIHVNAEALKDPTFANYIRKKDSKLMFSYIQVADKASLKGATFKLYITNVIVGVSIDYIEEDNTGAKIFFVNGEEKPWKLIKWFSLTEKDAIEAQQRIYDHIQTMQ